MNQETDFERLIADQIASAGMGMPPESVVEDTISRAGGSRQLPAWLALIKEPPMRTNNHLAVGSPTVRVAAIAVATLLLALTLAAAGAGVQRLLAADGPIVVAQDGSGHFTTIQAAVDDAADGDEILVRPGTYVEVVIIDKDIELHGDGPRGQIVVQAPEERQRVGFTGSPFGLALVASDATISGLTLSGRDSRVHVEGGSPLLDSLALDGVGDVFTGGNSGALDSIGFYDGSTAVFSNSGVFAGGSVGIHGMAEPQIIANTLDGGTNVYLDRFGPGTLFKDNRVLDSAHRAIGVWGAGPVTITGNTIENPGAEAIGINGASPAIVEGNTIAGSGHGIVVSVGSNATVSGNRIAVGRIGITWSGRGGTIQDNELSGGTAGIVVASGDPVVSGNSVGGVDGQGITIGAGASPIVSENTSCGNDRNLVVNDKASAEIDDSNEICADGSDA